MPIDHPNRNLDAVTNSGENIPRHVLYRKSNTFKFHFLTYNIRGINDLSKVLFLRDFLLEKKIDICFLQETHIDNPMHIEKIESVLLGFVCFFTIGSSKTKGVGILISKRLKNFSVINTFFDLDSRLICIESEFEKHKINLINIYAPNMESEQLEFIDQLYNFFLQKKI